MLNQNKSNQTNVNRYYHVCGVLIPLIKERKNETKEEVVEDKEENEDKEETEYDKDEEEGSEEEEEEEEEEEKKKEKEMPYDMNLGGLYSYSEFQASKLCLY